MSKDVRVLVGENVRRYRTAAGMSQAELAERMGVDRAYISGLESGARNPTVLTLWHTAVALGVDVSCLLVNEARKMAGKGPSRA
ncbi:helix-turn-helix domain-containing protein [Microvirga sp. RSM25]|uniref:helix-turn-helix domain-containing protein n=1 Tax=Microvirga sp. RSM25 TaxID=3273802 RepID=UPI00384FF7AC